MNRQQRRQKERELKKNIKAVQNLTPAHAKLINVAAKEIADKKVQEFGQLIDRNLSATLLEMDWDYAQIENVQNRMGELLIEDTEKSNKLVKENVDVAKIETEVKNYIEGLLEKGVNKKESIKDLMFKFPKLSKSMLLNAYVKVRKEKEEECKITREKIIESAKKYGLDTDGKKKIAKELGATLSTIVTYISRWKITEEEIVDVKKTDAAVEKIMDIIEEEPVVAKNTAVKEKPVVKENVTTEHSASGSKTIANNSEDIKEEDKPMENKLKVLSMTVEGENGKYKVCEKGVELQNKGLTMFFENIEQLENFTEEYKQVFKMVE